MENCIFCKIAAGEIPSVTIYEDEELRAILDIAPGAKGHALILPKRHFSDSEDMPSELLGKCMALGARIGGAQKRVWEYEGFHLLQNNGAAAGQSVFHFHLHVIPRRMGDGTLELWKPGHMSPEEMKDAGEALRQALGTRGN